MKKAIFKVPNGKLLKVFLEDSGGKIASVKLTGDFFVHPEENIEQLERFLVGSDLSQTALTDKINDFLKMHPTAFFGIDVESIAATILNAT